MALDFQNIPVSFAQGIDTKTDPKQLMPGKMLALQNASFNNPKEIRKRDGFKQLSNTISPNSSFNTGVGVASFQNELVTLDGQNLYSLSEDINQHIGKGLLVPIDLSTKTVSRNLNDQYQPDSAYDPVSGLYCYVWSETISGNSGLYYSIIDSTTGTQLIDGANFFTPFAVPTNSCLYAKVFVIGTHFVIVYGIGATNDLYYVAIDIANPTTIGAQTLIANNFETFNAFDATVINNRVYVAYPIASSTNTGVFYIDSTLTVSTIVVHATTFQPNSIAIKGDASNNVWVCYSRDVGEFSAFILDQTLAVVVLADTPLDASVQISNITLLILGTTADIYYECSTGSPADYIKHITLTLTGTVGTPTFFARGVGLSSKVFRYNGYNYMFIVYAGTVNGKLTQTRNGPSRVTDTQEPTYFLINNLGNIIMRLAPLNSGLYSVVSALPEIVQLSATSFEFPYLFQDDLSAQDGKIFFNTGVNSATFNFQIARAMSKLDIASNLLLASGQMWQYDGSSVVEQGFHVYPENLTYNVTVNAGGIGIGTSTATINQVQYVAIYEWQDNQGQLNRSATSIPITVPIPGTGANTFTADTTLNSMVLTNVSSFTGVFVGQIIADTTNATNFPVGTFIKSFDTVANTITLSNIAAGTHVGDTISTRDVYSVAVNIPTLKQTAKSDVSIVLYRTENNGTVFYRVTSLTNLFYNNPLIDFITITDTTPDNAIIGNEQLYTTGGEVDNIAPPAVSALVSYKNRALYLSPENPFSFGYSKQAIPGVPIEFNSLEFIENVDQKILKLSAIGTLDDKIILFGPTSKFYVVGDGPTPAGTNNDFSEAIRIAGTTGCVNQNSILELPIGLVYQDPIKGIYLLERSMQEVFIGADVSQYNQFQITSAQLFSTQNRAIFTLSNGVNLVYDYYVQQWEVDLFAAGAVDSTIYENDLTYIQSNGLEFQQTPGTFTDNGALIPMGFTTGWFSFAQIEGFQRVIEFQILGTFISPHTLNINIYNDYNETPTQLVTIPVTVGPGYPYRIRVKVQKCTAIKIQVTESQSGTIGEGLTLSGITFRVGIKKGLNKLPAGESY